MSSNLKDILDQIEQESLQEKAPHTTPQPAKQPAPQAKTQADTQPSQLAVKEVVPPTFYDAQASDYEVINEGAEPPYEHNKQRRRKRKRSVSSSRSDKKQSRILLYAALALCSAILVSAFFVIRAMYQRFDKRDRLTQQEPVPRRINSAAQTTVQPVQSEQPMALPSVMLPPENKSKELFNPNMFGLPEEKDENKQETEMKQAD